MKKDNSKELSDNKKIDRLIKLYKSYEKLKGFSDFVPKKPLPPLTLDEQIGNINPYYVKNELIKYGQS